MISTTPAPCYLLYFVLLVSCSPIVNSQNANITIPLNKTLTLLNKELYGDFYTIKSNSTLQLNFKNINKNVSFVIIQAHSHNYNITLYNNTKVPRSYITGTNVGLYSMVEDAKISDTFYILNENEMDLKLYISIHGYRWIDPIPGGCNLDLPVKISPFMYAIYNKEYIYVEAAAPKGLNDKCTGPVFAANLSFYMMYLGEENFDEDEYFNGIRNMMTLDRIQEYGEEIPVTNDYKSCQRMLSAYPRTGSIYVAVAKAAYKSRIFYSIYVPTHTYACNPTEDSGCELIDDFTSQLFCASLFFIGLFTCFFGHRFFKTEMFLVGCFTGIILTYVIVSLNADLDRPALLFASLLSGVLFGAIWLLFWWFYGIPVLAVTLPTLYLGFVCSAIIYYRLPGGHPLIMSDISFWSFFITIMLLAVLVMISTTFLSNILCCAVLGAYATVFSLDHYIGSNLKYIIINTLRRAVVDQFNFAVLAPPFQWRDIISTFIWVILATSGFLFQHYQSRGKPPFPPPPRNISQRMPEFYATTTRTRRYGTIGSGAGYQPTAPSTHESEHTDRSPLLDNEG